MTGPEHYREAQDLLRLATIDRNQLFAESNLEPAEALAAAQVHATLALTAATALGTWLSHAHDDGPSRDTSDWYAAVGPDSPAHGNPEESDR